MREFIIQENDANQRVDKFLQKTIPALPKSLMYKAIRNKKIKVNRKRCEISQRLEVGDHVLCFLAEDLFETKIDMNFLKVPSMIQCIYEDEDIILIQKPSGLLTHKDKESVQDNLQDRFLHYLYNKEEYNPNEKQSFTPSLCHRLDRNTEGIVITAKNAEALRRMNEHIKKREVDKRYVCIVEGKLNKIKDHIVLWHSKDENSNKVTLYKNKRENCKKIETSYKVLHQGKQYALVEVQLHTGKSHQIRSFMSYLGHPLYGDVKYGAKKNNRNDYQALCAYKVTFDFDDEYFQICHKTFKLANTCVEKLYKQLEKDLF